jgi:glycine/D-amino acid oxidase-like deaminating enzyme
LDAEDEMGERVVVLGGGLSGLIGAYVAAECGHDPLIIEQQPVLGGDFLAGGLRYIHRTPRMSSLLTELDVAYDEHPVAGGVLLRGKVEQFPDHLRTLAPNEAARIQRDHFIKTRLHEPGPGSERSMNDAGAKMHSVALRCDVKAMIEALAQGIAVKQDRAARILDEDKEVLCASGERVPYDLLIVTTPLWVVRHLARFYVPETLTMRLNVVRVSTPLDPYVNWDYVYTPYTPFGAVHRISAAEGGWDVEANGDWEDIKENVLGDINFLFEGLGKVQKIAKDLKGHLLKTDKQDPPQWPHNVEPLGRFAKWDPRATTDVTLDDAWKMAERRGWKA